MALFGLAAAAGCASHPKYMVDDMALAQVPMVEKQSIFSAEQDIAVARAEHAKAASDVDVARHHLAVAEAERDQARLEVDKAKLEQQAGERAHDVNRQKSADRLREIADSGDRAALAKVDMLAAKRKWMRETVDVADERIRAAMAKLEWEKAKLAAAKNIKPTPDFNVAVFADEYGRRQKEVDDQKKDVDAAKVEHDKLEKAWRELKQYYEQKQAAGAGVR
jgi:hypothetical protein